MNAKIVEKEKSQSEAEEMNRENVNEIQVKHVEEMQIADGKVQMIEGQHIE